MKLCSSDNHYSMGQHVIAMVNEEHFYSTDIKRYQSICNQLGVHAIPEKNLMKCSD